MHRWEDRTTSHHAAPLVVGIRGPLRHHRPEGLQELVGGVAVAHHAARPQELVQLAVGALDAHERAKSPDPQHLAVVGRQALLDVALHDVVGAAGEGVAEILRPHDEQHACRVELAGHDPGAHHRVLAPPSSQRAMLVRRPDLVRVAHIEPAMVGPPERAKPMNEAQPQDALLVVPLVELPSLRNVANDRGLEGMPAVN